MSRYRPANRKGREDSFTPLASPWNQLWCLRALAALCEFLLLASVFRQVMTCVMDFPPRSLAYEKFPPPRFWSGTQALFGLPWHFVGLHRTSTLLSDESRSIASPFSASSSPLFHLTRRTNIIAWKKLVFWGATAGPESKGFSMNHLGVLQLVGSARGGDFYPVPPFFFSVPGLGVL